MGSPVSVWHGVICGLRRGFSLDTSQSDAWDCEACRETRGHLADAIEAARRQGMDPEAAEREALERYDDARTVAAHFAAQKDRMLHWILLAASVALRLAIAWVDSRPKWDDAGATAGVLGLIGPRRPWLWALGIGIWIFLRMVVHAPTAANVLGSFCDPGVPDGGSLCRGTVRSGSPAQRAEGRQPVSLYPAAGQRNASCAVGPGIRFR